MNYDKNVTKKSKLSKSLQKSIFESLKEISIGNKIVLSELDELDLEVFSDALENEGYEIIKIGY